MWQLGWAGEAKCNQQADELWEQLQWPSLARRDGGCGRDGPHWLNKHEESRLVRQVTHEGSHDGPCRLAGEWKEHQETAEPVRQVSVPVSYNEQEKNPGGIVGRSLDRASQMVMAGRKTGRTGWASWNKFEKLFKDDQKLLVGDHQAGSLLPQALPDGFRCLAV